MNTIVFVPEKKTDKITKKLRKFNKYLVGEWIIIFGCLTKVTFVNSFNYQKENLKINKFVGSKVTVIVKSFRICYFV